MSISDYLRSQHVVRRVLLVGANCGIVEVDEVLVLLVVGAVASNVEGGRASSVLGEFMSPENIIGGALINPVLVH